MDARAVATVATTDGQTATGLVAFKVGDWYRLAELHDGVATIDLTATTLTTTGVTAYYLGEQDLRSSSSPAYTYEVVQAPTAIAVAGAGGELEPGASLPVTVTAVGSTVVPTGR